MLLASPLLLLAVGLGIVGSFYAAWAERFDLRELAQMPQLAEVYDFNGNLYSRLRGENRIVVPIDRVSPLFVKALVAREDTRFYQHHGVDPYGITRALVRNLLRGRIGEGASTITQQLARNSLPLGGRTFHRKVLEAFVALRIERHYSKQQILEFYVNRIYFGSTVYGVETASQTYFGKPCAQLDLSEAAVLAGLIRSPGRFSPLQNLPGAVRERDTVLGRMSSLRLVSPEEAAAAQRETVRVSRLRLRSLFFQDNYAVDAVNHELHALLNDDQLAEGGFKIYATLDPLLEKAAADALEVQLSRIENRPGFEHPRKRDYVPPRAGDPRAAAAAGAGPDYLQGALVAVDNQTGGIRALVGGRDYAQSSFNRATNARRQIGSTFKPFVYAAAFDKGLYPGASVSDGPLQPGELKSVANSADPNAGWQPGNSDHTYGGVLPAEVGLIRSRNTMSVRVGELAGIDEVLRTAQAVGLGESIPSYPTTYLGAFECDLRTLTEAYSVFPNGGRRRPAYLIERIDDAGGKTLYQAPQDRAVQAMPAGVAWLVSSILEKVVKTGTAAEMRTLGFVRPAAGKTGTTNDYKDAWFVGYTSSLTCGVWVGMDKNDTIKRGGYGAALALPIWCQFMGRVDSRRYPANPFQPPEPLRRVTLCRYSNQLATDACEGAGSAYALDVPESLVPRRTCFYHGGAPLLDPGAGGPPPPLAGSAPSAPPAARDDNFPTRVFRSFRHLFGGR